MSELRHEFLRRFVERVYRINLPDIQFGRPDDHKLTAQTIEPIYVNRSRLIEREILAWQPRHIAAERQADFDEYGRRAGQILNEIRSGGIHPQFEHFEISDTEIGPGALETDFIHIKVNHGYWEQVYAIVHQAHEPDLMRIKSRYRYLVDYEHSYFMDALNVLMADHARLEEGTLRFPDIKFGFSFGNGDHRHAQIVRTADRKGPEELKVLAGVAIGARSMLAALTGAERFGFVDGAFAKVGLRDGTLESTLRTVADSSDEVVFVVPPHLEQVRMAGVPQHKQSTQLVSGKIVHQSWILSLHFVSEKVMPALEAGRSVAILTQSAVFSALMGLYLKSLKDALKAPGRLHVFDLGQVLDLGVGPEAGQWAKRAGIETDLFTTMAPAS
jgi:hypothetical protein